MTRPAALSIRRIEPHEGATLRALRLRSLADAPHAFGQPIEEARDLPEVEWQQAARRSSRGDSRTWLFARLDDRVVGLVQGRRRRPSTLLLFSMWVEPSARRLGVGRQLIEALEGWARDWQAQETILWVYGGNAPAIRFYRDLGFDMVEDGDDAESGARFGAIVMRHDLLTGGG